MIACPGYARGYAKVINTINELETYKQILSNLKCKHCRLGYETINNEISLEVGIKLLKEAKQLRVKIFNFSGGEPFLRNDMGIIVKTL